MAGGNVIKIEGTFSGNGTRSITIPCNFYPDIIYIDLDATGVDLTTYSGILYDFIWKDKCTMSCYDNSTSASATLFYGNDKSLGMADYIANTLANRNCFATVTGSAVTVDRTTTVGTYKSGYTYNYIFIKFQQ